MSLYFLPLCDCAEADGSGGCCSALSGLTRLLFGLQWWHCWLCAQWLLSSTSSPSLTLEYSLSPNHRRHCLIFISPHQALVRACSHCCTERVYLRWLYHLFYFMTDMCALCTAVLLVLNGDKALILLFWQEPLIPQHGWPYYVFLHFMPHRGQTQACCHNLNVF